MDDIKTQLGRCGDLIHVLPTGSGGAHERELEFAVVDRNIGCYLNKTHGIPTASGHSRTQEPKRGCPFGRIMAWDPIVNRLRTQGPLPVCQHPKQEPEEHDIEREAGGGRPGPGIACKRSMSTAESPDREPEGISFKRGPGLPGAPLSGQTRSHSRWSLTVPAAFCHGYRPASHASSVARVA